MASKETQITQLNRESAAAIQQEIAEAIRNIAAKHGLSVKRVSAKFTTHSLTIQSSILTKAQEVGAPVPQEALEWEWYHRHFNLKKEWLGAEFTVRELSGTCRVIGFIKKNRKYPVIIENNGSRLKVSPSWLIRAMA